jgi:hypothetical protein
MTTNNRTERTETKEQREHKNLGRDRGETETRLEKEQIWKPKEVIISYNFWMLVDVSCCKSGQVHDKFSVKIVRQVTIGYGVWQKETLLTLEYVEWLLIQGFQSVNRLFVLYFK